ncbi:MAG TPA: clostripain-related cysteine peptidase, partial [Pyrinomonadaceae bacterium]|nr:clostripain-related cysteine peptidase [Pyrinomonadaceae bacterium]
SLAITIFAMMFVLASQSIFAQAPEPAEWTLMFYMDADNNLEAPQMKDLEEMMAVGSTTKINLIGLIDRNPKGETPDERGYTNRGVGGLPNWTTAKYVVIEKGKLREMSDWGELNMGDPANLKKFLDSTVKQFPAKRYGLVFGDHGAGWPGILSDESAGGDNIDMTEMPVVLKDFTAKNGKLDLIGFDACLMANFEVARTVAPFAKTMVASEETEPGDGWNYTPLMTKLTQNPEMDSFTLGKAIVDTYRDYYFSPAQRSHSTYITLGVIDLSKIDALSSAISDLAVSNQSLIKAGGRPSVIKVAEARSRAEEFGKSDEGATDNFDVAGYAQSIKAQAPDAATAKAADAVAGAVNAAVVYKVNGPTHSRASGLSIYFPKRKQELLESGYEKNPFFSSFKWPLLLGEIFGLLGADTQPPVIQNVQTTNNNIAKDDVVQVTAKVNADDVDEATFVLARNEKDRSIIIGSIPTEPDEKGILHEEWDGSWFTISDGKNQQICPITGFEEIDPGKDEYLVEVPAQIRYQGGKLWRDITMYFVLDLKKTDATGEFVSAFEFVKGNPREIELFDGDDIRPVYVTVDDKGNTEDVASSDPADILHIGKDNDLLIGNEDVDPGNYSIGFLVTDYAGNTSDKFVDVTLK